MKGRGCYFAQLALGRIRAFRGLRELRAFREISPGDRQERGGKINLPAWNEGRGFSEGSERSELSEGSERSEIEGGATCDTKLISEGKEFLEEIYKEIFYWGILLGKTYKGEFYGGSFREGTYSGIYIGWRRLN